MVRPKSLVGIILAPEFLEDMRILFLSRWFPYPPDNGSRIRVYNLLKTLATRHIVHLISFTDDVQGAAEGMRVLNGWLERIELVPYCDFQPRRWKAVMGYFSPYPRSVVDTFNLEMKEKVEQFTNSTFFDAVIASQIDMARYLRGLSGSCLLLEELELSILYENAHKAKSAYRKARAMLTWWKLANYVRGFSDIIHGCTVVSEREKKLSQETLKSNVRIKVIPNGVDVDYYSGDYGDLEAYSMVYSGSLTYGANFDAMAYFLANIYPLVQAEIPQVKLYITGKVDGVPLERLPKLPGVIFTGYLTDIRPRVAQSWVSVAPLRVGGGTRLKILESLALGTPVVATNKGAEGLDLAPDKDLFIADQPIDFAQKVVRILKDRQLRDSLGAQGRKTVNERYSWHGIGSEFNQFIEEMVCGKAGLRGNGVN